MPGDPFTAEEDIAFYTLFRKELDKINYTRSAAAYNWHDNPDKTIEFTNKLMVRFFMYMELIETMSSDISNVINELATCIRHLKAWNLVIRNLNQRDLHHIVVEFIDHEAKYALTLPYSIKAKFIFATSLLSHQANAAKIPGWVDKLEPDEKIVQEVMDRVAKPWKGYKKFKLRLELIGNNEYRQKTNDFRNSLVHRFQQDICIGFTTILERDEKSDPPSYSIKQLPPLELSDIVIILEEEHEKTHNALELFKILVNEQISNFKLHQK